MSKEELNLLLDGWIDGDMDFLIVVTNPKAGEERKLLDSGEVRGLAELISARANDDVVPHIPLGYNKEQAAKKMGVSVNTFETLLKRNDNPIPSIKVGRRTIIPSELLNEWLRDEAKRQFEARERFAGDL